jgi:hypothetical protein
VLVTGAGLGAVGVLAARQLIDDGQSVAAQAVAAPLVDVEPAEAATPAPTTSPPATAPATAVPTSTATAEPTATATPTPVRVLEASGARIEIARAPTRVNALAIRQDGLVIVGTGGGMIETYRPGAPSTEILHEPKDRGDIVAIAVDDAGLIWSLDINGELQSLDSASLVTTTEQGRHTIGDAITLLANGTVVTGGRDRTVIEGSVEEVVRVGGAVTDLAASVDPSGVPLLAIAIEDEGFALRRGGDQELPIENATGTAAAVAFTPDGQYVLAGDGGGLRPFNTSGSGPADLIVPDLGSITDIATWQGADQRLSLVVVGTEGNGAGAVLAWDPRQSADPLRWPTFDAVTSVAIAPDGSFVVFADRGGSMSYVPLTNVMIRG